MKRVPDQIGRAFPIPMIQRPMFRDFGLISAVCFLCFFFRLASVDLLDFNESFYAQAAREMTLRGDWVTPSVNGVIFFDKPPLVLWMSSALFKVFGFSSFAARLPGVICATLISFLTWWLARRRLGSQTALIAAVILAISPMMFGTARQMTMDIPQALFFSIAAFGWFECRRCEGRRQFAWAMAFWSSVALGVLAKSVPGLFPMFVVVADLAWRHRMNTKAWIKDILCLSPLSGVIVMLLIGAPWFIAAWRRQGMVFYEEYWILHHVKLLTGQEFAHTQPFWYYVPGLLGGMFPWSLALIPAAIAAKRHIPPSEMGEDATAFRTFCWIWSLTIFVLFSLMKSKLVSYLLILYPSAAILIADQIVRTLKQVKPNRSMLVYPLASLIPGVAALFVIRSLLQRAESNPKLAFDIAMEAPPPVREAVIWSIVVLIALSFVGVCLASIRKNRESFWVTVTAWGVMIAVLCQWGLGAVQSARMEPLREIVTRAAALSVNRGPLAVFIYRPRKPSVFNFLPDRYFENIVPVQARTGAGVFETGEIDKLNEYLANHPNSLIITEDRRVNEVSTSGRQTIELARSGKYRLIGAAQ